MKNQGKKLMIGVKMFMLKVPVVNSKNNFYWEKLLKNLNKKISN